LMFKKTEKYIRQNQASSQKESVQHILNLKSMLNNERQRIIHQRVQELVSKSRLFVSGDELEISSEEARSRVLQGFYDLIRSVYSNLRMLRGVNYREEDIHTFLSQSPETLFGDQNAAISEAESEMQAFIPGNNRAGIRTTLKSLMEKFNHKPYGWSQAAVQCILAKLCARGKVELRSDGNLLEGDNIEQALRNTHGFANLIIDPQIDFTPAQIRWLKEFYNDFFDRPPAGTDARQLGKETSAAFHQLLEKVEDLTGQVSRYPFLSALHPALERLSGYLGKPYPFFLTDLSQQEDELFDLKETIIDPLQRFMNGDQRQIYDQARRFVDQQEANFLTIDSELPDKIQAILKDPDCFRDNNMRDLKKMLDELKGELDAIIQAQRQTAKQEVSQIQTNFQSMPDFQKLSETQQYEFNATFESFLREIDQQNLLAVIRDSLHRFKDIEYTQLLNRMNQLVGQNTPTGKPVSNGDSIEYISASQLDFHYSKSVLNNEAEINDYLTQLRQAMLNAIQSGKRIRI
jgi:hypothetical protein